MPVYKHRKIERMLLSKLLFCRDETDHSIFVLFYNGRKVLDTKLSHQSRNTDIPKSLAGKIARDLELSGNQLREAVSCTLSRNDYIGVLCEKELLRGD